MRLLFSYLLKQKKILILALVLATVNQVFSLLDPQIFRLLVDNYASKVGSLSPEVFFRGALLLVFAAVGVNLVSRIAKNFQDYYVNATTQRVGMSMYADGVSSAFSLPYAVFEDQRSGELLQKLQKARADAQAFITASINVIFLSAVSLILVIAYAFYVQWLVGLTYLLLIPALGITTFYISRKIKAAQKRIVVETAELAGATTETLRNVELVKSLGLEQQETKRLNDANARILGFELAKVKLIRMLSFVQGTLINLARSLLMLLMLWLLSKGEVSLGEFFTLLFYSFAIFTPLYEFSNVASNFQEARASLENLEAVLKSKPAPKIVSEKHIHALNSVQLSAVNFAYSADRAQAVAGVTLDILPGKTVAFVGPSGSGKTTLVKLLVGLYKPTAGRILINNTDSNEIHSASYKKHLGYVSQETQLFSGTIGENLRFVKPDATDEECLEALRQAAALPIIERGGKGLATRIGESGIKVSGGERQRLAIARALLRNPSLIIFDEATSSLDSLTEKEITKTIQEVAQARPKLMTVLVAHRLSTIAHADTIYVLEKGKIVEQGRHNELLATHGLYAALWREQSAVEEK